MKLFCRRFPSYAYSVLTKNNQVISTENKSCLQNVNLIFDTNGLFLQQAERDNTAIMIASDSASRSSLCMQHAHTHTHTHPAVADSTENGPRGDTATQGAPSGCSATTPPSTGPNHQANESASCFCSGASCGWYVAARSSRRS